MGVVQGENVPIRVPSVGRGHLMVSGTGGSEALANRGLRIPRLLKDMHPMREPDTGVGCGERSGHSKSIVPVMMCRRQDGRKSEGWRGRWEQCRPVKGYIDIGGERLNVELHA